ncbi:MAG: hypothetical protein PHS28_05425 [Atopobiaceae bacterium]|jgi:hypothetical protein|nr:hypothetical protein [Atopobiaceae bacterium]
MPVVGVYKGRELLRVMGTSTYLTRLPVGGDQSQSTHDTHVRVRLGTYDNDEDAFRALVRRIDATEAM